MNLDLKKEAIKLRTQGNTYTDINKKLKKKIPKSTLSEWFKKLKLTPIQKRNLDRNVAQKLIKSQKKAWLINKKRRLLYLEGLKNKNLFLLQNLDQNVQKLLLSILYLGEGAKSKSTSHLSLGSTNPKIIRLYFTLLRNSFEIDNSKFRIRIQRRSDQDANDLENYWQDVTNIPRKQFYPTYADKRTINKPTLKKDYKGVCVVMYFDRSIQFELEFLYESVIKYLT